MIAVEAERCQDRGKSTLLQFNRCECSRGREGLGEKYGCGWYNSGMKDKTSITLSKDVLKGIDRIAGSARSRSAFIETVLREYLRQQARAQIEARDLELINKAADELNDEVEDILGYQATEG